MSHIQSSIELQQQCRVVAFPPARQRDRVQEVARRLMRKRSEKSADQECSRIADEMFARLERLGMNEAEQDEAVGAFFFEVDCEMDRLAEAKAPRCACGNEA